MGRMRAAVLMSEVIPEAKAREQLLFCNLMLGSLLDAWKPLYRLYKHKYDTESLETTQEAKTLQPDQQHRCGMRLKTSYIQSHN